MPENTSQRPIECSRVGSGRSLLFAGGVFALLLSANLLVVGHLVFRDLGTRMSKEAIAGAQDRAVQIAQQLAQSGQIDLYRMHLQTTTISEYVAEVLTRSRYVQAVTLYDANDQAIQHWRRMGETVFSSELGFHQPPRPIELPEADAQGLGPDTTPSLRVNREEGDSYVASVPILAANGTIRRGMIEVGVDQDQLGREIEELRRALTLKIALGAAVSVLLLLVAFAYVVRLVRKTRRFEAEAQMADRLAYVGTLASGLAHEIRNPLNALNMNLQMLEEEVTHGQIAVDAEAKNLLASTKGEIKRLENLVSDFLMYARPTAPRLERCDLNQTVSEVVRFLRADVQAKGVQLETALYPMLPAAMIDEGQFRQAILNIVMNAKEVLGPGGRIDVATGLGPEGEIVVTITDNGPGIPDDLRQKIFEVFYSTRGGGTGLGLPIAQRIMESHGGWIDLLTEVGRGTTFTLHVPRAQTPVGGTAPSVVPAR